VALCKILTDTQDSRSAALSPYGTSTSGCG